MKTTFFALITTVGISTCALADGHRDERGGTCADARQQYKYFCEKEGYEKDIMLNAPLACNNARRNMAAACEGVSEKDHAYEFDEGAPAK
jgi:hypothetical protein